MSKTSQTIYSIAPIMCSVILMIEQITHACSALMSVPRGSPNNSTVRTAFHLYIRSNNLLCSKHLLLYRAIVSTLTGKLWLTADSVLVGCQGVCWPIHIYVHIYKVLYESLGKTLEEILSLKKTANTWKLLYSLKIKCLCVYTIYHYNALPLKRTPFRHNFQVLSGLLLICFP